MSGSWWPFRRRSDKSEQPKSPGKGRDKRQDKTRRIVRHVKKEALRPKSETEPEPPATGPRGPDVVVYGNMVHVNFHWQENDKTTFVTKDPVTKKTTRVARRFNKSRVFYNGDGSLIDDDMRT